VPKLARNHHFVPQGYLAGFTDTGTREGRLYVLDLQTQKAFATRPRNVAAQRDFNRIDVEDQRPDALEQALGDFEDRAIAVIRWVRDQGCLPEDNDFSYLLNLMCLLVVRNPRLRQSLTRAKQQGARIIMDRLVSDRRLWEHHMRKALEAGDIPVSDVSFEQMKRFVEEEGYAIEIDQQDNLRSEFRIFDNILHSLADRCWSLLVAAADAPHFITSDHPISQVFKDPHQTGPIGVELRQTELVFPLNSRQALLGVFEEQLPPRLVVEARDVAVINTRTLRTAERQVYSVESVFTVM